MRIFFDVLGSVAVAAGTLAAGTHHTLSADLVAAAALLVTGATAIGFGTVLYKDEVRQDTSRATS